MHLIAICRKLCSLQAKQSVALDLYLNEKDIKNIKIFDKKCECYEWFKIC